MKQDPLATAREAYRASVSLWFEFVNSSSGHPGLSGPSGDGSPWDELQAYIQSTIDTLKEVQKHRKA